MTRLALVLCALVALGGQGGCLVARAMDLPSARPCVDALVKLPASERERLTALADEAERTGSLGDALTLMGEMPGVCAQTMLEAELFLL